MPPTAGPVTRSLFRQNFHRRPFQSFFYVSRMYSSTGRQGHLKPSDVIRIKNLSLNVSFKDGTQWQAQDSVQILQPVKLSMTIVHDLRKSGETDDLDYTLNYASLASLVAEAGNQTFASLEGLVDDVYTRSFGGFAQIADIYVQATKPKAILYGKGVTLTSSKSRHSQSMEGTSFILEDMEIPVVIGINPEERTSKQVVRLNVSLSDQTAPAIVDYHQLSKKLYELVASSSYLTVEAFASSIARNVLQDVRDQWKSVTVRVEKPHALALADSAEIEITRTLADFPSQDAKPESRLASLIAEVAPACPSEQPLHKVALALGSNLGDSFANIEAALRLLETPQDFLDPGDIGEVAQLSVVDTSFMYETAPMYVTDQPNFINCACMVETNLSPTALLRVLKKIETAVGRVPSIRNGPRAVDIDVLFYGNEVIDTRDPDQRSTLDNLEGQLVVPHPRIAEREFVLRPLNDMVPEYYVPSLCKEVKILFEDLIARQPQNVPVMRKVIPFPKYPYVAGELSQKAQLVPSTAAHWTYPLPGEKPHKTRIMATLNATPDSFSDGSVNNTLPAAIKYATSSVASGADIIDIGGYSTRPHAEEVSPLDEIGRVVPVIEALRGLNQNALVSIDTFRPDVARAAVMSGANCINDVYAFTGPEYPLTRTSAENFLEMRKVARDLAVPVILTHSRGEASANKNYKAYDYAGEANAIVEGVRVELAEKVEAAVQGPGGLRRWLVIVDPGVGFSKSVQGNLDVLRNAVYVTSPNSVLGSRNALSGYPQLIGASRKSFLGSILAQPNGGYEGRVTVPKERGWATAAAVACAVQQKALVVRVHDVMEMGDVARVATALWG